MAADVCGPTADPPLGSTMGPGATVSVVGMGGPTPQDKCLGARQTAHLLPQESKRARQVPLEDPTPVLTLLGSGRSRRPGEVLFLLGEDIRPVENLYRVGDPKDYCVVLLEPARGPRKGTSSP